MILAVCLFTVTMSAQEATEDFRDELQLGLKIGANYSNVFDETGDEFNADPKFGLAAGAFLAIPIGTYLGFHPEILFSQKGFRASGSFLTNPYEFKRTTTFIDVPLLFAFKPVPSLAIVAGPQYSYLIRQKDVFSDASASIIDEQEFENDNLRRNLLCFLGGVDFNMGSLILGGRVGWDILNNNGDGTTTNPRYKNVWYQATIGFRL